MPTGYTHDVQTGKVTKFKDFAMQCARAFGALSLMRDDPMDAPIPEKFEPQDHDVKAVDEARKALADFDAMTVEDRRSLWRSEYEAEQKQAREQIEADRVEEDRYRAMLSRVRDWTPPSDNHVEFKQFMVKQLEDSIRFDCAGTYWKERIAHRQQPFDQWVSQKRASLLQTVARRTQDLADEIKRANERTQWVRQLRDSLK